MERLLEVLIVIGMIAASIHEFGPYWIYADMLICGILYGVYLDAIGKLTFKKK